MVKAYVVPLTQRWQHRGKVQVVAEFPSGPETRHLKRVGMAWVGRNSTPSRHINTTAKERVDAASSRLLRAKKRNERVEGQLSLVNAQIEALREKLGPDAPEDMAELPTIDRIMRQVAREQIDELVLPALKAARIELERRFERAEQNLARAQRFAQRAISRRERADEEHPLEVEFEVINREK